MTSLVWWRMPLSLRGSVEVWEASSVILPGYSWSETKICLSPCEIYGLGPYGGAPVDPQFEIEW